MTKVRTFCGKTLLVTFLWSVAMAANAATVWTGPWVEFNKAGSADPTQAENQDSLTPLVSLTRGSDKGLFNILQEEGADGRAGFSPVGTEWAFQGLNGNPDDPFTAEDYADLTFAPFAEALSRTVGNNILERPGVVHLLDEDIYFDIIFLEWETADAGADVAYRRISAVPVPAAAWLLTSALGLLGFLKRRRPA